MILEQLNECDIILQHRTKYQDVLITEIDGLRSLYLDGDLQFDDDNESYYHTQMIKNLNEYVFSKGIKNSNVCVMGGGDGGIARELLKYNPKYIKLVEIDPEIIDICIKYFPALNNNGEVFKQIDVHHMDGMEYLKGDVKLDAVILDITIPYEESFKENQICKTFVDSLVGKVDILSWFISYKSTHLLDFNIFSSFKHYTAYKVHVPRYEHNEIINIVAKL